MKKLLKILSVALSLIMVFSLFACDKKDKADGDQKGDDSVVVVKYTVSLSGDDNGTLTSNAENNKIAKGSNLIITVQPNEGYEIDTLLVNGANKTQSIVNNAYTIENVSADVTATATFKIAFNDMPSAFYNPSSWVKMTDAWDGYTDTVQTADGGIKFTQNNTSYYLGYQKTQQITFMLKSNSTGENGFTFRLRSKQNLEASEEYYVLGYQWDRFFIQKGNYGEWLSQITGTSVGYNANSWNKISILIQDTDTATEISLFVNGNKANFTESTAYSGITYENGTIKDVNKLGNNGYFSVKSWNAVVGLRPTSYTPSANFKKIACVGDSITYSQGASAGNSYPDQLQKMLGSENYEVSNFGYPGAAILPQSELQSWSYSYWDRPEYLSSLSYRADIVIIMFGANDGHCYNWGTEVGVAGVGKQVMFKAQYESLIDNYRTANPNVEIYIAKPTKTYGEHYTYRGVNIEYAINSVIEQLATEKNCTMIDLLTPTSNHQELSADGVHWTDAGYYLIAQTVYNAIASV